MNRELYHYGIKGMRWGVRKKYEPIGDKKSSKTQDTNNKKRKLTDKQKTAIKVGAAAAAIALAAYGTYRLKKSGKLDEIVDAGKQKIDSLFGRSGFKDRKVSGLHLDGSGFKMLGRKESVDEALSKVNVTGSKDNCYNCVAATVGRLCGFDVTAKGDTQMGKGMSFDSICRAFKLNPDNETDVRRVMNPSVDKLTNIIGKKFKEGDVGAIGLNWNDTYKKRAGISEAGHTLNWMIKDGKVTFMDSQVNVSGDRLTSFMKNFLDSGKEASIAKFANVHEGLANAKDILKEFAD